MALGAARLEACAFGLSSSRLELAPCAGVELGALSAKLDAASGLRDTSLWGANTLQARALWRVVRPMGIEARVGGMLPWIRYEFAGSTGETTAYRAKALAFDASLGIFLALD